MIPGHIISLERKSLAGEQHAYFAVNDLPTDVHFKLDGPANLVGWNDHLGLHTVDLIAQGLAVTLKREISSGPRRLQPRPEDHGADGGKGGPASNSILPDEPEKTTSALPLTMNTDMSADNIRRLITNQREEHAHCSFASGRVGMSDFSKLYPVMQNLPPEQLAGWMPLIDSMRETHSKCHSCYSKVLAYCILFTLDRLPELNLKYTKCYNEKTEDNRPDEARDYMAEVLNYMPEVLELNSSPEWTQLIDKMQSTTKGKIRILQDAKTLKRIEGLCQERNEYLCQEKNVSDETFNRWKKHFNEMEAQTTERLKELERENIELSITLARALLAAWRGKV